MAATEMTMEQVVGANLTRYREGEGISQAEFGRRIGQPVGREWSRQAVSLAEAGKRSFGVGDLLTISQGTGMTVAELLTVPDGTTVTLHGTAISHDDVNDSFHLNETTSTDIRRWKLVGWQDAHKTMAGYLTRQAGRDPYA